MPLPTIPHIFFTPPSMLLSMPGGWPFLCTVALSMVTGFLFGSTALLRILGFNARARAYNGFLALLGIYTGVLALINFSALPDYVTLLNACVAFQTGHFFRATASRRGYIVILILLAAYAGLYIWGGWPDRPDNANRPNRAKKPNGFGTLSIICANGFWSGPCAAQPDADGVSW